MFVCHLKRSLGLQTLAIVYNNLILIIWAHSTKYMMVCTALPYGTLLGFIHCFFKLKVGHSNADRPNLKSAPSQATAGLTLKSVFRCIKLGVDKTINNDRAKNEVCWWCGFEGIKLGKGKSLDIDQGKKRYVYNWRTDLPTLLAVRRFAINTQPSDRGVKPEQGIDTLYGEIGA